MNSATSPNVLCVEALSAGYNNAAVVRDLNLRVDAGEVVAMLGPNGAGKSTTLHVRISGLVRPMSGTVSFLGSDLAKVSGSARRDLA